MHERLAPGPASRRIANALAVGALVTAWEAVPELVAGRAARWAARGTLVAVSVPALIALTPRGPASVERPRNSWATLTQQTSELADLRVAGVAAVAGVATLVAANGAERRGRDALVRRLAGRGHSHPRMKVAVLLGLVAAISAYVDPPTRP